MFDRLLTRLNARLTVSKLYDAGILMDLDKDFYQAFAGKYYHGLPVNYVLQRGHVDMNIHAPEALTLAIGKGATWCSGTLHAFMPYDAPESAARNWVEVNSDWKSVYVLEPNWGMAIEKEIYYNVFGVEVAEKQNYHAFIKARQKNPADVNLYCREDYEEHGVPLNPNVIRHAQDEADLILCNSQNPQKRAAAQRLLAILPDLTKCKNLVEPSVKLKTTAQRFAKRPRKYIGDMIAAIDPSFRWKWEHCIRGK